MREFYKLIFKNVKLAILGAPYVMKSEIKSEYYEGDFERKWKNLEQNNCIKRVGFGDEEYYLNIEFYKDLKKEFNML